MLIDISVLKLVNAVENVQQAKQIVNALNRKIEAWQRTKPTTMPAGLLRLARENKTEAVREVSTLYGMTLCDALKLVDEHLEL